MNISSAQASAATSAVRPREAVNTPLSPISSLRMDTSTGNEEPGVNSVAISQAPNMAPSKTEELILMKLQKLSAGMSKMKQEMQEITFSSTPRRRKRVCTNRTGQNSVIGNRQ